MASDLVFNVGSVPIKLLKAVKIINPIIDTKRFLRLVLHIILLNN